MSKAEIGKQKLERWIAVLLLVASTALALGPGKGWQYKQVDETLGTYTEAVVPYFGGATPEGVLYLGHVRQRAFKDVVTVITNELNQVETVTNSVPLPVAETFYNASEGPRARTEAENAAYAAQTEAARQAALVAKTAQYAEPLALVIAAFARFEITPPIEFDQAAYVMNQKATTVGDIKLVLMAKMAYERHLEPAGITGDTLAQCAGLLLAQMQGGQ